MVITPTVRLPVAAPGGEPRVELLEGLLEDPLEQLSVAAPGRPASGGEVEAALVWTA